MLYAAFSGELEFLVSLTAFYRCVALSEVKGKKNELSLVTFPFK